MLPCGIEFPRVGVEFPRVGIEFPRVGIEFPRVGVEFPLVVRPPLEPLEGVVIGPLAHRVMVEAAMATRTVLVEKVIVRIVFSF